MTASLGMKHIALSVRDIKKSASFYGQAFGMRPFGPVRDLDGAMLPLVSPGLKDQITLVRHDQQGESRFRLDAPPARQ